MLETPIIIVIAVAAALVVVVAAGAAISIHLQRKRTRKHLTNLSSDIAAYQRTRLSAYDSNYEHVQQPTRVARGSRLQPIQTEWPASESQERIHQEELPAQLPDDKPMPPKARRKRSLRDSLYGHSAANVPKTRRQKKIAKAISLKDMNRSPLSAITELTDSTEPPNAVELPTERTPKVTPDKEALVSPIHPSTNWSLPIDKRRNAPMSPVEIETPISLKREPSLKAHELTRSGSKQSDLSEAPEGPLPPLPIFNTNKSLNSARRQSSMSTDTVGSSVLGTPSEAQGPFRANSGMQDFDFGFTRVGPSPGRTTGWCPGSGVASVVPSFDFQGRQWSTNSVSHQETIMEVSQAGDKQWTPSAEFFFGSESGSGTPRQPSDRHSMLDYSSSTKSQRIMEQHRQFAEGASPAISLPPRPASVASSNPHSNQYKLDHKPSFASSRLSTGSTSSGRGHRRQNCIRISIPAPVRQRRPSLISEILEDSDDEIETSANKVQVIDITKVSSAERNRTQARRSIVNDNGSPIISPLDNRPTLSPSKPRRTASYASRNSPVSRPESDIFYSNVDLKTMDSKPKTPDPFANPDLWALAPTPPSAATLNPPGFQDSPTLPSPLAPLKISSNTSSTLVSQPLMHPSPTRPSRLMGPRSPPSVMSTNVHLQTASAKSSPSNSPTRIAAQPVSSTSALSSNPTTSTDFQSTAAPSTAPASQPQSQPTHDVRQSIAMLRSMDSSGRLLNHTSRLYAPPQHSNNFSMSSVSSRNNHDEWKELNSIWEVASRSNSIDSISTRATSTRKDSFIQPQGQSQGRAQNHRYSLSQGNALTAVPEARTSSGMSRNNSMGVIGGGHGNAETHDNNNDFLAIGGDFFSHGSSNNNIFNPHNRYPSSNTNASPPMFGTSKRKISMASSNGHRSQPSWNIPPARSNIASGESSAQSTGILYQGSNWGQFGNMSRAGSPGRMSMASMSGMSIWEDESIRGESPEPGATRHNSGKNNNHNNNTNRKGYGDLDGNGPGPALTALPTPKSTPPEAANNKVRPNAAPQGPREPRGLGISTTTTEASTTTSTAKTTSTKPKPIIFDDAYSVSHLVSPLNDSDMENLTPTTANTTTTNNTKFDNSRYAFNFPAVPSNNGKRVPSRGSLAQQPPQTQTKPAPQQQQQHHPSNGVSGTSTPPTITTNKRITDLRNTNNPPPSSTLSTPSSSILNASPSPPSTTRTTTSNSTATLSPITRAELQPQPLRSHIVTQAPQQQQQQLAPSFRRGLGPDGLLPTTTTTTTPKNLGLGLHVGDKLLGTPGSLRSLYDGEGFLRESPLRGKVGRGSSGLQGGQGQGQMRGGGSAVAGTGSGGNGGSGSVSMAGMMARGEGVGWARR